MSNGLIKRSDALECIEPYLERGFNEDILVFEIRRNVAESIQDCIKNLPTEDKTTRCGHWFDIGSLSCRCSNCGCKSNRESKYCPNCGATMTEQQLQKKG